MKKAKAIVYGMMTLIATPFISFSQDRSSTFSLLLSKYYDIKNALVSSDAASAAKTANEFVIAAKNIDTKALSANEQSALKSVQEKLLADANGIAANKDIAKQRTAFQALSESVITITKFSKVEAPAYIAFCPMKKAYWITSEQAIKNPYYGNSMLTCGKITDTLK
jgi:hypothetical protein